MQLIIQKSEPIDINWLADYLDIKALQVFSGENFVPDNFAGFILQCDEIGLSLSLSAQSKAMPTRVDFCSKSLQYRLNTSKRSAGLLKAIGMDKYAMPLQVLDLTAGMGADAYIMAAMGCHVAMVEKSGIMAALLSDGLQRGRTVGDLDVKHHLDRMTLRFSDAHTYLKQIQEEANKPDIIYLDPMFPHRQKSAKVKKDMALMQQLLPPNDDVEALLEMALASAGKRVVLKRPGKLAQAGRKKAKDDNAKAECKKLRPAPDFQVPGKSCHFQVFIIK